MRLKSEKYKGYIIHFHKGERGLIYPKAPKLSNEPLGYGKTKKQALKFAKSTINIILKKKR